MGVRGLYQDHGYFKVVVSDPDLKTVDVNRAGMPGPWPVIGAKHGKAHEHHHHDRRRRAVPHGQACVSQLRSGSRAGLQAGISGASVSAEEGRHLLDATRSAKRLTTTGSCTASTDTSISRPKPLTDIDDAKKIVNLTMEFDQQKQFFVRRIEFSGNTTTRDKVIRRELLLDEGQVFNNRSVGSEPAAAEPARITSMPSSRKTRS